MYVRMYVCIGLQSTFSIFQRTRSFVASTSASRISAGDIALETGECGCWFLEDN